PATSFASGRRTKPAEKPQKQIRQGLRRSDTVCSGLHATVAGAKRQSHFQKIDQAIGRSRKQPQVFKIRGDSNVAHRSKIENSPFKSTPVPDLSKKLETSSSTRSRGLYARAAQSHNVLFRQ